MSIEVKGFREAQELAQKLPEEMQLRAVRAALKDAAKIVESAARLHVPTSRSTGTYEKQSKKQKAKSPKPLFETITHRIKNYPNGVSVVVVGPSYPEGSHGHLVERGHIAVYWGRTPKGNTKLTTFHPRKQKHQRNMPFVETTRYSGSARVEGKEFLAPAADSTQKAQERAIIESLQKSIKRVESQTLKAR